TASSLRSCNFNFAASSLDSTCERRSLALSPVSAAACLSRDSASASTSPKSLTNDLRPRSSLEAVMFNSLEWAGQDRWRGIAPRGPPDRHYNAAVLYATLRAGRGSPHVTGTPQLKRSEPPPYRRRGRS